MPATRKLAAILVADVAGYSRLMREDEALTYAAVRHLRDQTLPSVLEPHAGHLVKDMGDGFLVTFDSAVQAVECGMALQRALAGHEMLELRIGVNVGDVIVEEADVFGDGVNVAARIEGVCTPGGVAMSESVYEQVRDKLALTVETLAPQMLKNIDRPVGVRLWKGHAPIAQDSETLELPDKPSIAALAFANMSSDPEQDFFADGIAEDIITALSRIERFFVVARTSSFSFKGQNADVKEIGEALGVRYVLEGSVRAAGGRLRVTAQLIEAATGRHIWAEKYDRMAEDVFDIQDEITQNVTASTQTQIDLAEGAPPLQRERLSLPVWKLLNIAWRKIYEMTADSLPEAIVLSEQAINTAPDSGRANLVYSMAMYHHALVNVPENADELYERANEYAEQAVRLAPHDEYSYWARGLCFAIKGDNGRACVDYERAIDINPNCSLAYGCLGSVLARMGRHERALKMTQTSIRINPRDPSLFFRYCSLGLSFFLLGEYEKADHWAQKATNLKPDYAFSYMVRAAVCSELGQLNTAAQVISECTAKCGGATLEAAKRLGPAEGEDRERFLGSLREAGIS